MAKEHWSDGMAVLCWCDTRSNGRMRMSWHRDITVLRRDARAMPAGSDPVLYTSLGERSTLVGPVAHPPGAPKPKAERKAKPKAKRKPKPAIPAGII